MATVDLSCTHLCFELSGLWFQSLSGVLVSDMQAGSWKHFKQKNPSRFLNPSRIF